MKKVILAMVVFAAVGLTACNKCDTCSGGTLDGQEYCESNNLARDVFEASCQAGGGSIK